MLSRGCSVSVSMEKNVEILSSATNAVTMKVLVSFFLSESVGSASAQAIDKEKFSVPNDARHKELYTFKKHMVAFIVLKEIASTKGLGQNPEITIARVKKNQIGGRCVLYPHSRCLGTRISRPRD